MLFFFMLALIANMFYLGKTFAYTSIVKTEPIDFGAKYYQKVSLPTALPWWVVSARWIKA